MKNEFISYEEAVALKKLGFNEPCLASYETAFSNKPDFHISFIKNGPKNYVLVPLYQQAFRWFREKYSLHCNIDPWGYCIFDDNNTEKTGFKTYEEAELECLKKLIEIVKKE